MILKKIIKLVRNAMCLIGLISISPFLFLTIVIIILEDGFPVFFTQKRFGKNKKIFNIIKIRTLKKNTPITGTHELQSKHLLTNGKWIRKIKFDEFPQLINVLMGDVNIVGPRPGLINQKELLNERSIKNIYSVKPGITGLAQILGYDMSNPKKLSEIDETYIMNKSFGLDLFIILGTFFNYPKQKLKMKYKI
jgi:O-antigen biosynthesis protein WbqP